METIITFTPPESVSVPQDWVEDILERHPAGSVGDAELNMLRAGCAEIRSAVNGHEAVLFFKWRDSPVAHGVRSTEYVKSWTTYAGWPYRIEDAPTSEQLAPVDGATSMVSYEPDVNGRPCTPPGGGPAPRRPQAPR